MHSFPSEHQACYFMRLFERPNAALQGCCNTKNVQDFNNVAMLGVMYEPNSAGFVGLFAENNAVHLCLCLRQLLKVQQLLLSVGNLYEYYTISKSLHLLKLNICFPICILLMSPPARLLLPNQIISHITTHVYLPALCISHISRLEMSS